MIYSEQFFAIVDYTPGRRFNQKPRNFQDGQNKMEPVGNPTNFAVAK